jgi:hypothetical protein
MWPRANQAHVASQDIPKLRQLVKTVLAKKPAEACNARIVGDFEKGPAPLV